MFNDLTNWFRQMWLALSDLSIVVYIHIFPELPEAGSLIFLLSGILFLVYTFKAGLGTGLKIGGTVLVVSSFILFLIHSIHRMISVM